MEPYTEEVSGQGDVLEPTEVVSTTVYSCVLLFWNDWFEHASGSGRSRGSAGSTHRGIVFNFTNTKCHAFRSLLLLTEFY